LKGAIAAQTAVGELIGARETISKAISAALIATLKVECWQTTANAITQRKVSS